MSHLANSLQCNKVYTERLPHPPRRRPEEATNVHRTPTSTQSQAADSSEVSSMNVVHPMPAAPPAPEAAVTSSSPHSTVSVPAVSVPNAMNGALPSLTARLEFTSNGSSVQNTTRLVPTGCVPIHIPFKVQSPGQIILVPCQSQMINGNQLTTPMIPVMSPPTATLASSPLSSAGSSGSVAISPAHHFQSPQKPSPQPLETGGPSTSGTIMYASYPAPAAPSGAAAARVANLMPQAAAPYPIAYVAMGDPSEMQNEQFYQNLPRFLIPANPPNGSDPVWRPW